MNFSEIKQELLRKIFHINILILPIANLLIKKAIFLKILIPLALLITGLDFLRKNSFFINQFFIKIFGKIMRAEELSAQKLSGLSWTFIAACFVFAFCKPVIATAAFAILAISDAAASIVGKTRPSAAFFEKSQAGSMAFFSTAALIVIICGIAFGCNFSFFLFGLFFAATTTAIEARPSLLQMDDNFSVPISFAFFMTLLDFMWGF